MTADVGTRIRDARHRRGLTQDQLAAVIGGTKSTISKIEGGDREVKSGELADIADALDVSMRDLLGRRKPLAPLALAHRLGDADVSSPSAEQARRHLRSLLELQALLDELEIPTELGPALVDTGPVPSTSNSRKAGRKLAQQVRDTLGLGTQPIGDLETLLEQRFGVDVVGLPLEDGRDRLSGMCVHAGALRMALVNTDKWPTHQRFTLAHELAHLLFGDPKGVTHEDSAENFAGSTDPVEVRANAFAAEFLMPEAALAGWVTAEGTVTESAFAHVLFTYDISVETLVHRLDAAGLLAPGQAETLLDCKLGKLARRHNHMAALREMAAARGHVRPPTRLYERALRAYCDGRIGVGPLAGLLGRDEEELRDELDADGFTPDLGGDADGLAML